MRSYVYTNPSMYTFPALAFLYFPFFHITLLLLLSAFKYILICLLSRLQLFIVYCLQFMVAVNSLMTLENLINVSTTV